MPVINTTAGPPRRDSVWHTWNPSGAGSTRSNMTTSGLYAVDASVASRPVPTATTTQPSSSSQAESSASISEESSATTTHGARSPDPARAAMAEIRLAHTLLHSGHWKNARASSWPTGSATPPQRGQWISIVGTSAGGPASVAQAAVGSRRQMTAEQKARQLRFDGMPRLTARAGKLRWRPGPIDLTPATESCEQSCNHHVHSAAAVHWAG
jgi:hypothetical protein